ncbi:hypothetical protein O181_040902 [Austropuccinia psidii MF-1]|uniref:Uncharacterized protein n=1 Tax=Austropuccinia psidii MF-1 TaxID=1389203 RepID=A0A9Q3DFQ7_9BASI|nr:hypothetical protein [Austropuccinia psidii MF-1]
MIYLYYLLLTENNLFNVIITPHPSFLKTHLSIKSSISSHLSQFYDLIVIFPIHHNFLIIVNINPLSLN